MKTTTIFLASILFFFITPTIAQAQIEVKGTEDILSKLRMNKAIEGTGNDTYQDIEGSAFMFEDFLSGNIKLKDGGIYNGLLRYDKYAGEIHFKKDDEIYAIAFPEKVEYIQIADKRFIYSDYKLSETEPISNEGGYFVVLIDKNCKLLAKKNIMIKDAQASKGVVEAKPAKFIDKSDSYFIKTGDLPAIAVKSNISLIYIFADKEAELSSFISKEKISFKKLNDLIKVVNYYNSII